MPMRRHSRANVLAEPTPPDLEARLAELEAGAAARAAAGEPPPDFDSPSWMWMILFGIVVPVILLIIGWRA
jgi:hypothetical protein